MLMQALRYTLADYVTLQFVVQDWVCTLFVDAQGDLLDSAEHRNALHFLQAKLSPQQIPSCLDGER